MNRRFFSSAFLLISALFLLAGCSKASEASEAASQTASLPRFTEPGKNPIPPRPETPPAVPAAGGLECAERTILLAAKKNVAENYDNSPTSHGYCAMGVRTSLQRSRVGDVTGGLGNAIDYLKTIKPHGFVDSGLRDPRTAPPGSVLVFSGPKSEEYLRTGDFGSPAGTWLGHVTIKGDDGRYYTDGRTREPALGWQNNRNEDHIRNVAAIFVPGKDLAAKYNGKCARIAEREAFLSLVLAANDAHTLDFFSEAAETEGKALVKEGLEKIEHLGELRSSFTQVARLALEAGPFDEEGQLVQAVQRAAASSRDLRLELEDYLHSVPRNSIVERCKAERLEAELAREACLSNARIQGQDSEDGLAGRACGKPFAYVACLRAGQ